MAGPVPRQPGECDDPAAPSERPTAGSLIKATFDARRGLARGHVVLLQKKTRDPTPRDPKRAHYGDIERRYDLTFDGPKVRSVVEWKHPKWSRTTRTVVDGSSFINDVDGRHPVVSGPYEGVPPHDSQGAFQPRLLGLMLGDPALWYKASFENVLQFAEGEPSGPVRDPVDAMDALRIDYRRPGRGYVRVWFAPRFANALIRIELGPAENEEIGGVGPRWKWVLSSSYKEVRPGGIWYPERVILQRISDGEVREEDLIVVEEATFGVEVDPALFGFGRLGLPAGRRVMLVPNNRMMVWTGERLRPQVVGEFGEVGPEVKPGAAQIAGIGRQFDLSFTDAIDGRKVSMEGLRGKVVVVDFWATWCGPCVAELPAMKALYARYRDRGVEFIGVSLDEPEEKGGLSKLKALVEKEGIAWPQYYQGKGWEGDFSRSWDVAAIPTIFVVDRRGRLASVDARGRLEAVIEGLLDEKGSSDRP